MTGLKFWTLILTWGLSGIGCDDADDDEAEDNGSRTDDVDPDTETDTGKRTLPECDAIETCESDYTGITWNCENRFMFGLNYAWREFANKLPFVGGGSVDLDRFFYGIGAQYTFNRLPDSLDLTIGVDYDRQVAVTMADDLIVRHDWAS